jgi:ABC-type transport system involved in multi-copper enzyme maturation permease subunit
MKKATKIALSIIGILLLLNGFGNIVDDARILTYDIASILSGIGFILASRIKAI